MIDRLHLRLPVETFKSIQLWLTIAVFGLAPLFFGSVDQVWVAIWTILLLAIYGLVALALTPDMLLWAPKTAYLGNLTATFVNHNTAATFVGAGVILWFCSAWLSLQSLRFSSIRLLLLMRSNEHLAFN